MSATARSRPTRSHFKGASRDLRLLAVSAQITEISYSISDIQTRIFGQNLTYVTRRHYTPADITDRTEIQELRHQTDHTLLTPDKPVLSSPHNSSLSPESTGVIDQALINLDERLEAVARSVDAVEEGLAPLFRSVKTPTQNQSENVGEADKLILRKHNVLMRDWDAVQTEAEVLREELKEDKWLTVFRSVSEQADGMMKSLEKAVTQCQVCEYYSLLRWCGTHSVGSQDFIWQVNRRCQSEGTLSSTGNVMGSEPISINLEAFTNIHNAFESKKKCVTVFGEACCLNSSVLHQILYAIRHQNPLRG